MSKKRKIYWLSDRNETPCHTGPLQIVKNLFCGSEREFLRAAKEQAFVDTMVPLCGLDGEIWKLGFRGEILYYPIEDFGVLPDAVLDGLVTKVLERLRAGRKVGLFCMGGHGRTGYIASIILGKLGHRDPIEYLRGHYCSKAVESSNQVHHIAKYLKKPELTHRHDASVFSRLDLWEQVDFRVLPQGFGKPYTCGSCSLSIGGVCYLQECFVEDDSPACDEYTERETGEN